MFIFLLINENSALIKVSNYYSEFAHFSHQWYPFFSVNLLWNSALGYIYLLGMLCLCRQSVLYHRVIAAFIIPIISLPLKSMPLIQTHFFVLIVVGYIYHFTSIPSLCFIDKGYLKKAYDWVFFYTIWRCLYIIIAFRLFISNLIIGINVFSTTILIVVFCFCLSQMSLFFFSPIFVSFNIAFYDLI